MSANFQPKSNQQVRAIFGLARERDLEEEELRAVVEEVTGSRSISQLSSVAADQVIERLGGQPLVSRRTVQHRRKGAGVKQVAQPAHLELMRDLARQRRMSDEGLASLAQRMRLPFPPRTTAQTNKLVEALKAMNRRDQAWAS